MMKRLAALFAIFLLLLTPGAPAHATDPPGSPAGGHAVTLITGDRVSLVNGTVAISAARWPGRRVAFHTTRVGGSVRVVPSDVAHLVGDVLDPQLFDITALAGYKDTLPLIVRGLAATGQVTRALSSVGGVAIELSVSDTEAFGRALIQQPTGRRIWLDAPVHADTAQFPGNWAIARFDPSFRETAPTPGAAEGRQGENLRQIGAPAAWAAGLTGVGVRIAVLDTGVDDSHPDLRGRVAEAENFSDSPDVTDRNGHGTHVASIASGTRGTAPNATLLSAKVLGDGGTGQLSDVIAGMEWAVAHGARVVNMSLSSGAASTGSDPLSLAVDALSREHGTLFVASAGNLGPAATTIGAPGAAASALTVGAVDRRDRLAGFSSRGPRLGDYAIKPDLAAPGVDILAARAAGTDLGKPAGPHYTRLSGTSMAAPHGAGAAALIAQQRPQWTGAMLKSLLIGMAHPLREGAFDTGSGRLDIADALPQRVIATEPSLSFGFAAYPQSGTLQRTVTLAADISSTVDLSTDHEMLSVTPSQVDIPAGGRVSVTVEMAVAQGGFGAVSGTITARRRQEEATFGRGEATRPGIEAGPLRVPAAVFKESTRHLLHIRALDRLGTTHLETLAWVFNTGDITASPPDPVLLRDGEATVRVRPGNYAVTAAVPTLEEGEPDPDTQDLVVTSITIATVAEVDVRADTEVVLDARAGRPISAAIVGVETTPVDVHMFVAAKDRAGNQSVLGYATSPSDVIEEKLFVVPTQRAKRGTLELSSKWRLDGPSTYDLLFAGPAFPSSLEYRVDPRDLATVRTTYRTTGTPIGYNEGRFVFTAVNPVSVAIFQPVPTAPLHRTEYLATGPKWSWHQCANVIADGEGIGGYCQTSTRYRIGVVSERAWLTAPLRTRAAAFRTATQLFFGMDDLADGPNGGSLSSNAFAHRSYELYRNGVLVARGTEPFGSHNVAAGAATFRLTRAIEQRPGLLGVPSRVETSWTFTSIPPRPGRDPTTAPLVDVTVEAPVDDTNRVRAGVLIELRVRVAHPGGRLREVSLEVSTDSGLTWYPVKMSRAGEHFLAPITLPEGPVSLRTKASDANGNHTEQTVWRAFIAV